MNAAAHERGGALLRTLVARGREINVNNITDAAQYSAPLTIWAQKGNSHGDAIPQGRKRSVARKDIPRMRKGC
jgi:hypothetical protein